MGEGGQRSLHAVAGNCRFSMYLTHTSWKEQFLESNPLHNLHRIEGSGMRGVWGRFCLVLLAEITSSLCSICVPQDKDIFSLFKKISSKIAFEIKFQWLQRRSGWSLWHVSSFWEAVVLLVFSRITGWSDYCLCFLADNIMLPKGFNNLTFQLERAVLSYCLRDWCMAFIHLPLNPQVT